VWPLSIGLRTLGRLAPRSDWLDPAATIKVPRLTVYAVLARSLVTVWSTRALRRHGRRLRARVPA
jgi:hypothetical protein